MGSMSGGAIRNLSGTAGYFKLVSKCFETSFYYSQFIIHNEEL